MPPRPSRATMRKRFAKRAPARKRPSSASAPTGVPHDGQNRWAAERIASHDGQLAGAGVRWPGVSPCGMPQSSGRDRPLQPPAYGRPPRAGRCPDRRPAPRTPAAPPRDGSTPPRRPPGSAGNHPGSPCRERAAQAYRTHGPEGSHFPLASLAQASRMSYQADPRSVVRRSGAMIRPTRTRMIRAAAFTR